MAMLLSMFPEYTYLKGTLSHKKFNILLKKLRRKRKRRAAAVVREQKEVAVQFKLENSLTYLRKKAEKEREEEIRAEFEEFNRKKNHDAWLQRENVAEAEFKKKQEILLQIKMKREEQEKCIKEEWEKQQLEEQKAKEQQEKIAKEKELLLSQVTTSLRKDGEAPWHNPILDLKPDLNNAQGTEKDKENCPFFTKTGACRFGDRCSRNHSKPVCSPTLLIPSMYSHFSLEQGLRDEFDSDISLEYEDKDMYIHFKEFYQDVVPEFTAIGPLVQFKVCCNYEPHLRGNVYIQFECDGDALRAYNAFNGRWYGGRQLSCQFTHVINWKAAICGLFDRKRCPKGKNCNFLHVFSNPDVYPGDYGDEFSERRNYSSSRYASGRSEKWERYRSHKRSDRRNYRTPERNSVRSSKSDKYRRRRSRSRSPSRHHRTDSYRSSKKHRSSHSSRRHKHKRSSKRSSQRSRRSGTRSPDRHRKKSVTPEESGQSSSDSTASSG